jgi:hypothetical protein
MKRPHSLRWAIIVLLGAAVPAWSQEKQKVPPEVQQSIDAVRNHIDKLARGKGVGEITWKGESAVAKTFADYHIINARFRIYPVARQVPEGLNTSSLFAVTKNGKVEFLKDVKSLEKFFRAHQAKATDDDGAKTVLGAWLTLTQEFHQDGFFKFDVLSKEFAVAGKDELKASGRAVVMAGGNGQLIANLTIDKDGKLAKVEEVAKIRPGPRPICQATKLLDADPIVRRIAEQDLLIMGLPARDYLMEQRERAAPELRLEIDRLWRQIQKNGW